MNRFVAAIILFSLSSYALAANETHTIATGLGNIVAFLKALLAAIWNIKIVLGLVLFFSGIIGWHKNSRSNATSNNSILLPITAVILGGFLAFKGAIDLGSEMLTLEFQNDNGIQLNADGRANVASMATYSLKKNNESKK
ncbi:hypothetical protein BOO92_13710 [Vibrio navarrensis]|uniref:hypothetical protein n=1 Tax=Vibrio TaxID=662 RepID=UPI0018664C6C|nr:hypothetical protein [Vibrio navarrensis]HAS6100755.1 hypothetical protein [Vibrio vulnificus]EHA1127445.1 hypothetical protein [Vibrio navarrensis]MBE3657733.1 hypothetical protein [Vibrio navarrensis]MBH9739958.1 hypothetical protein [Vibrio navarrensis]HDY8121300.1 hypothetical protein [Vibrio vulnificus]